MEIGTKEKVGRGFAWSSAAGWGCKLLSFGFFAFLARILTPSIFGLVAIAWVYVSFVQVFVRQGFGSAIIQRRDLEAAHLDSAFWIALATGSFLCLLSFVLAGPIAHIFREPRVAPVLGWLSLTLPLGALGSVPGALLGRELDFRTPAVSSLLATTVGGTIGVTMALYGWGVWSLVGQQLVAGVMNCTYLWLAVPWRPHLRVSKRHLRDLYGFSLSLTANDVLWFFAQKSDQTMVGYGFGSAGLGPYSLGSRVNNLLLYGIVGPLHSVAFPMFSKLQSAPLKFERALFKFCEMSSFVLMPVLAGTIVVAPELVPSLFGPKWISAVPILQILAFYGFLRSFLAFVHPVMLAKGRTQLFLVIFVVDALLTFIGCLIAVRWSPEAVAFSMVVTMFIFGVFEFTIVCVRVLGIRPIALLRAYLFPAFSTLFMVLAVALLRSVLRDLLDPASTLIICIAAGISVYIATTIYLRPDLIVTIAEMAGLKMLEGWRIPHRSRGLPRGSVGQRPRCRSAK